MDNNTLEVTPDNHLLVKIFDNGLNPEKQISLPVPEVAEGSYVFGLSEFGVFYGDHKYDITDHVFNDDDNLEILYSVYYLDMMNDKAWRNFYVADETGATIKSLEESVINYIQMNEIEGQEDQMSFILGEGEAGSSIKMFDIPSWNTVYDFPAVYNGDLLSVYYNRIPNNVAKDHSEPFFTVNGNPETGNLSSSGFLNDENGKPYKLYMNYYKSGSTLNTTEFYDIPIATLHVNNVKANNIKVYTDKNEQLAKFTETVAYYNVYSTSG